jgi:hypothetical protein
VSTCSIYSVTYSYKLTLPPIRVRQYVSGRSDWHWHWHWQYGCVFYYSVNVESVTYAPAHYEMLAVHPRLHTNRVSSFPPTMIPHNIHGYYSMDRIQTVVSRHVVVSAMQRHAVRKFNGIGPRTISLSYAFRLPRWIVWLLDLACSPSPSRSKPTYFDIPRNERFSTEPALRPS